MKYKTRLFSYFLLVFGLFTITVIGFKQWRERAYKVEMLCSSLLTYSYTAENELGRQRLPEDMRVTVIGKGGKVLFDNRVSELDSVVNHYDRPEIIEAKAKGTGYDIRTSKTTGAKYFYFARHTPEGYVRVAMPYSANTEMLLASDRGFVLFVVLLFVVAMFFLWRLARRFGLDVDRLKAEVTMESEAMATLKSEMTSAIAHELRTPVASIRSYSETLRQPDIDPTTQAQFVERIHSASLRLSSMLENVSLLTKMEEAPDGFLSSRVNLSAVVSEVVYEFESTAKKNSATIVNSIPDGIEVQGNQTLIYSIFRNLIENSLKYAGSWITITLTLESEDEAMYHFVVTDSGGGVDEKHLPRLFERFYRIDNGRTRTEGGSGLGLSIVAHAVANHRGTIYGKNALGGGLEVHFTIRK